MIRPTLSAAGLLLGISSLLSPQLWAAPPAVSLEGKNIRVEFNSLLHSRIVAKFDGQGDPARRLRALRIRHRQQARRSRISRSADTSRRRSRDELGHGRRLTITGTSRRAAEDPSW